MTAVLTIANAHKSFGQTKALDGAAMTLNKGEWLALLGPNGAGKTTLIRAICARVQLDQGDITILGTRLNGSHTAHDRQEVRSRLGLVPQDIALYPLLTGEENLRAFGELHGVRGSTLRERVRWALDWTGLADRARSLVKTYSGGMERRLNIACGVLHQPEIVLLDEPTVGVDPQSRQRIWEMLDQLRRDGASLLLTTHQLDEAQQICDRITIIDKGRTIADGTFTQLVERTIGPRRVVTLRLDREPNRALLDAGLEVQDRVIRRQVDNVADELPELLALIDQAGHRVDDLKIESPTLQAVFIHMTGRELRE